MNLNNFIPTEKRHKMINDPIVKLAIAILESGIKENDRFKGDYNWLELLCDIAGCHPDDYFKQLDMIFGPRRKYE